MCVCVCCSTFLFSVSLRDLSWRNETNKQKQTKNTTSSFQLLFQTISDLKRKQKQEIYKCFLEAVAVQKSFSDDTVSIMAPFYI